MAIMILLSVFSMIISKLVRVRSSGGILLNAATTLLRDAPASRLSSAMVEVTISGVGLSLGCVGMIF